MDSKRYVAKRDTLCDCWSVGFEYVACGAEIASFYGPEAEARAKAYAEYLNTQEGL